MDGPRARERTLEVPASRASALQQPRNEASFAHSLSQSRRVALANTQEEYSVFMPFRGPHQTFGPDGSARKGARSVHGRHRVAGGVAEGLCVTLALAFCARRELARGLCACSCLGSGLRGFVPLEVVLLDPADVKQEGKSTLAR